MGETGVKFPMRDTPPAGLRAAGGLEGQGPFHSVENGSE